MSQGGVHGDVICGPARLWLLDLGRQSFLLMILPVLWLVDLITEERNDNEELEALILGLAPDREAELREIARDGGTPD